MKVIFPGKNLANCQNYVIIQIKIINFWIDLYIKSDSFNIKPSLSSFIFVLR